MSEPTMRREIYIGPGQEFVVKATGDPLSETLDAIVAEGHLVVAVVRWPSFSPEERWECRSHLHATSWQGTGQKQYERWEFSNHAGEVHGATALESAQKRLDQIRLGKSLTWLAFAAPDAP